MPQTLRSLSDAPQPHLQLSPLILAHRTPPCWRLTSPLRSAQRGHQHMNERGPAAGDPVSTLACGITNRASAAGAGFAGAPCARSFYGIRRAHKRNSFPTRPRPTAAGA